VIAIDEFEELLGRGDEREEAKPTEADDFLSSLAELLKLEGSQVLILATLRSDFLGSLQLHPSRLNSLMGDPILLDPMDVDGFRQVIEGPAQRVGARLETGLSDRLVRLTSDGQAAKQPARWETLPAASRRLVGMFVEARLLVSGKGSDGDAVEREGAQHLADLLAAAAAPEVDRQDAARVLALGFGTNIGTF
jgi:hypothetical protein